MEIIRRAILLTQKKFDEEKLQQVWFPIIKEYYNKNKLYELLIDPIKEKDEFIDRTLYVLIDIAQEFHIPILDVFAGKIDESILELLKAKMNVDLDRQLMVDQAIMEQIEEGNKIKHVTQTKQQNLNKKNVSKDKIIKFPTKNK